MTDNSDVLPQLGKFCIFCGQPPNDKNKEHPIPMWLIEATGDPHRVVHLVNSRRPFSTFHFPSCTKCNSKYGEMLETKAQRVVLAMLQGNAISAEDINTLLDWLDKVRIGLWLASCYLGKNHIPISPTESHYIKPKFHIESRIAKWDRMVAIYETSERQKDIAFTGIDSWLFVQTPSCFALLINHLVFFNLSIEFLFNMRMGFPYPKRVIPQEDGRIGYEIIPGTEKITPPILPFPIYKFCTRIYQPMYGGVDTQQVTYYDTEYVRSMSLDVAKGIGKPFIDEESNIRKYPSEPSDCWVPRHKFPVRELLRMCSRQQFQILREINRLYGGLWKSYNLSSAGLNGRET